MLSYRELYYYQQQDNFQLLQNAMQVQRLEDERMRQLERLYLERSIINERKGKIEIIKNSFLISCILLCWLRYYDEYDNDLSE